MQSLKVLVYIQIITNLGLSDKCSKFYVQLTLLFYSQYPLLNFQITKENENVQIQFYLKKQPEYIVEGNRIIFRQGNVIGLGIVKNIVPLLSEAVT